METLATERLVKQPAESRLYSMDFANLLGTGETLSAVTSVACTPTGLTLSNGSISGTTVLVRISGGTDGELYRVEFVVTTSGSNTLEADGELMVHD